jgi:hypothetical protein
MNIKPLMRTLLIALALGTTVPVASLAAEPTDAQRQAMEVKIHELRDRLALSPEQEQKLAPILEERNAQLKALWSQRHPDSSRREKRALLDEAKAIQEAFTNQIEPILSKEQMRQWEAFRKEVRSEVTERYRNRQN